MRRWPQLPPLQLLSKHIVRAAGARCPAPRALLGGTFWVMWLPGGLDIQSDVRGEMLHTHTPAQGPEALLHLGGQEWHLTVCTESQAGLEAPYVCPSSGTWVSV